MEVHHIIGPQLIKQFSSLFQSLKLQMHLKSTNNIYTLKWSLSTVLFYRSKNILHFIYKENS